MKYVVLFFLFSITTSLLAQRDFYKDYSFNEADTLRGMLRPERTAYDVHFYHLNIKLNIEEKTIKGYVDIHYNALEDFNRLQIDLYDNMKINKIIWEDNELSYQRKHNAVFIDFPKQLAKSSGQFRVFYEGKPQIARQPPWDGGFVWSTDANGQPWIAVACEGDGASLWWPNKDHLSEEPDSMAISIAVPKNLYCVSNGDLISVDSEGNYNRYNWLVSYPINNYNVTLNIAAYTHFSDTYTAKDGSQLPLDYYVLGENEQKAKKHFQQVPGVLEAFEHYFGKYPFWEDGFALVETPYLGMEHQSAIAYGNTYKRGYLGSMIPRDMNWDYIIVHETGHEYFGNSITCYDLAEMWIQESFTTYMEALYVEYHYSYKDAVRYLMGQRGFIANQQPIIGPKDVNWENWKSSDHYFKGSWVLHTLRSVLNDDELWFRFLKGFYQKYKISNVTTEDILAYLNEITKGDFTNFFEQYLYYPDIPILEYKIEKMSEKKLTFSYRWDTSVANFEMPVKVGDQSKDFILHGSNDWQSKEIECTVDEFRIRTDLFYIKTKNLD